MLLDIIHHIVIHSKVDLWYILRLVCRDWRGIVDRIALSRQGEFFYDTMFAGHFDLSFVLSVSRDLNEDTLRTACIRGSPGLLDCIFTEGVHIKTTGALHTLLTSNPKSPQLARCILTFIKHGRSVTKECLSLLFAAKCNSSELLQYIFDRRERKYKHKPEHKKRYKGTQIFSIISVAYNCDHINMLLDNMAPNQHISRHTYDYIIRRKPSLTEVLRPYLLWPSYAHPFFPT